MTDIPVYQYQQPGIRPTASPVASLEGPYQAYQAGLKTGVEVPTALGAAAQGITEAYKTYADISYKEASAENLKADAAYRRAMTADVLDGTARQKLDAELEYKTAQTAELKQKVDKAAVLEGIKQTIQSGSVDQIRGLLTNGQVAGLLFDSYKEAPGILAGIASRVGNDPESNRLLSSLKANLDQYSLDRDKKSLNDVIDESAIKAGVNAQAKLFGNNILQSWFPDGKNTSDYFRGTLYPNGLKTFDPKTGKIDLSVGDNPEGANYDQYVLVDPTGKLISSDIDKETANLYTAAKRGYKLQVKSIHDQYGIPEPEEAEPQGVVTPSAPSIPRPVLTPLPGSSNVSLLTLNLV